MAFKDSLLFNLFHREHKEKEKNEGKTDTAEDQTVEDLPPRDRGPTLELPADHALHKLRNLRSERKSLLELRFDSPSQQYEPMIEGDAKRELSRLQVFVTSAANKRFADIQKAKDNENGKLPDMDAHVMVFLTSDQISAWIMVYPPVGAGKELDRDLLTKALQENGIVFGVEEELLDSLPTHKSRYFRLFMVAHGKRPVNGKDGHVVDLFPRLVRRAAKVDEFGRVDYTSLNLIQNVEQGDTICQIFLATPGEPGRTVLDKELPAKAGKEPQIPKGRNTEVSKDGTLLVATQAGSVEFTGRSFQVKSVFYIDENVDYSTGNVNFWGDVRIRGDVCSGFTVRATGTITVEGVVESSTLEAGCDLIMAKGVQGNGTAVIRAHRNIYAKYLENCSVYAKENLHADCILNCDVYTDGSVFANSGRGIIIGGCIRSAHEVRARVVGTQLEGITQISLGGTPYEEFEYTHLLKEKEELEAEMLKIQQQPDSRAKFSQITKLKAKMITNKNKLTQYIEEMELLKVEAHTREAQEQDDDQEEEQDERRLVCDVAYPGTLVSFGDIRFQLEKETKHCTVTLKNDKICIQ